MHGEYGWVVSNQMRPRQSRLSVMVLYSRVVAEQCKYL